MSFLLIRAKTRIFVDESPPLLSRSLQCFTFSLERESIRRCCFLVCLVAFFLISPTLSSLPPSLPPPVLSFKSLCRVEKTSRGREYVEPDRLRSGGLLRLRALYCEKIFDVGFIPAGDFQDDDDDRTRSQKVRTTHTLSTRGSPLSQKNEKT